MAKSVKQLQAEILSYLDSLGQDQDLFRDIDELKGIDKLLVLSAANFILKVQENLRKSGSIDTGALSTDIASGEMVRDGETTSISIGYPAGSKSAKYYDFVNKGVKGFIDESKAPNSPYKYKSEYPKYGGVLHKAILGWYRRNSFAGRKEDAPRKSLSQVQRKRKKLLKMVNAADSSKSLAYATAINIKRKGLKTTGFFDKAVEFSFGKDFNGVAAKIIGREVVINIRNGNNNK